MRIPKDIPLAIYIKRLIAEGKVEQFYWTEDWKELRADVLEDFHNECQDCLKQGRYTKAECVHHHNEVRNHPSLALSKWYVNPETGKTEPNLIPLCNACHNIRHPEKTLMKKQKNKFTNEEKW